MSTKGTMGVPSRQRRLGTPPVRFDYNSGHSSSQAPPSPVAPEQPGADLPGNSYRIPQQTLQSKDLRLCPGLHGRNTEEPERSWSSWEAPGRATTFRAAKRIEDAMWSLGDVEFEYLMLEDVGLAPAWDARRASSGAKSAVRSGTTPTGCSLRPRSTPSLSPAS